MATMNISVPDPMKDWVQSQVNTGTYANTSDYVRDLIRQDQDQHQHQHSKLEMLQAAITAGIESGVSDKSFDQIIEQVRHELKSDSA